MMGGACLCNLGTVLLLVVDAYALKNGSYPFHSIRAHSTAVVLLNISIILQSTFKLPPNSGGRGENPLPWFAGRTSNLSFPQRI